MGLSSLALASPAVGIKPFQVSIETKQRLKRGNVRNDQGLSRERRARFASSHPLMDGDISSIPTPEAVGVVAHQRVGKAVEEKLELLRG
jgi:hypothetical protein